MDLVQGNDGMAFLTNNKEKFEVALEMGIFTPKEIQVTLSTFITFQRLSFLLTPFSLT